MSEYQKLKERAQAAQQERERQVQRDIEIKAERLKQQRLAEEERRKRQEAASREARTAELRRANEAINKGKLEAGGHKLEYDPFAEEERRPTPPVNLAVTAKKPEKGRPVVPKNGSSGTREKGDIPRPPHTVTGSGTRTKKVKEKETSPPALGRKEKAAKALMESAKRGGTGSIFSVRSNINPKGSSSSSLPATSLGRNGSSSTLGASKSKIKGRGGPEVGAGELRQLCPERGTRDNRTIDQIQRDIKARKAGIAAGSHGMTKEEGKKRSRSPEKGTAVSRSKPSTLTNGQGRIAPITIQRRRQPSPTPSTSSSSDSDDSRTRSKSAKRLRPDAGTGERVDVSAMIQDIFRRPNRAPVRPVYSDEESGSDMEAGLSDVEEEERRAIRIARREDELAEKEERERKARKEKLRLERERGGR